MVDAITSGELYAYPQPLLSIEDIVANAKHLNKAGNAGAAGKTGSNQQTEDELVAISDEIEDDNAPSESFLNSVDKFQNDMRANLYAKKILRNFDSDMVNDILNNESTKEKVKTILNKTKSLTEKGSGTDGNGSKMEEILQGCIENREFSRSKMYTALKDVIFEDMEFTGSEIKIANQMVHNITKITKDKFAKVLEQYPKLDDVEQLSSKTSKKLAFTLNNMEDLNSVDNLNNNAHIIEYDTENKQNGKIDVTNQGNTGDCWLLTTLNALSYSKDGAEKIKNMLEYRKDGVNVKLATGDVFVSNDEIAELKKYSSSNSASTGQGHNGSVMNIPANSNATVSSPYSVSDIDVAILEKAVQKVMENTKTANNKFNFGMNYDSKAGPISEYAYNDTGLTNFNTSLDGGSTNAALFHLLGIAGEEYYARDGAISTGNTMYNDNQLKRVDSQQMQQLLNKKQTLGNDYVMTCSKTNTGATGGIYDQKLEKYTMDVNGIKSYAVVNNHAYAVKSVDDKNVTLINPWDSSQDIVITREEFVNFFDNITALNLSENSDGTEYAEIGVNHYSDYSQTYMQNNVQYKADYDYEDGGYMFTDGKKPELNSQDIYVDKNAASTNLTNSSGTIIGQIEYTNEFMRDVYVTKTPTKDGEQVAINYKDENGEMQQYVLNKQQAEELERDGLIRFLSNNF